MTDWPPGRVLPLCWVIWMCRRFDPLFWHFGDWTRSFWGTFCHPLTSKRSFGGTKTTNLYRIRSFWPQIPNPPPPPGDWPLVIWTNSNKKESSSVIHLIQHVSYFCDINLLQCYAVTTESFFPTSWWRHQMETFSPVNSPQQRPVTRSFNVFFDLRLNKRLSKHSWSWWFETLSRSLWCHHNVL